VCAGTFLDDTYQFISVSRYGPIVHESSHCDTAVKEAKSGLNRYKQLQTGVQLVVYVVTDFIVLREREDAYLLHEAINCIIA